MKANVCFLFSFVEKGRVCSGRDILAIHIGPEGLFFTGDEGGVVTIWKLKGEYP